MNLKRLSRLTVVSLFLFTGISMVPSASASDSTVSATPLISTMVEIDPAVAIEDEVPLSSVTTSNSSPDVTAVSEFSIGDILNWVCKTVVTMVAIAVWIPTVVSTGGTTAVVLSLVVRYVSVPAIACAWL